MGNPEYGKVVGLIEERPVYQGSKGNLIPGNTLQFLDLLLRNAKGDEKVVRVPVEADVADFYEAGAPKDAAGNPIVVLRAEG